MPRLLMLLASSALVPVLFIASVLVWLLAKSPPTHETWIGIPP